MLLQRSTHIVFTRYGILLCCLRLLAQQLFQHTHAFVHLRVFAFKWDSISSTGASPASWAGLNCLVFLLFIIHIHVHVKGIVIFATFIVTFVGFIIFKFCLWDHQEHLLMEQLCLQFLPHRRLYPYHLLRHRLPCHSSCRPLRHRPLGQLLV